MKNNKWKLTVHYWQGQTIIETLAVGKTKKETLMNWFFQYYKGNIPRGACLPSNTIQKEFVKL